jgi:3-hydroxymyristoyl/3-hydroxydecanoyl-(acyl carrier protein) dehydratase
MDIAIPRNHCLDITATIAIANKTIGKSTHKVNKKVAAKPTIHRMML